MLFKLMVPWPIRPEDSERLRLFMLKLREKKGTSPSHISCPIPLSSPPLSVVSLKGPQTLPSS